MSEWRLILDKFNQPKNPAARQDLIRISRYYSHNNHHHNATIAAETTKHTGNVNIHANAICLIVLHWIFAIHHVATIDHATQLESVCVVLTGKWKYVDNHIVNAPTNSAAAHWI